MHSRTFLIESQITKFLIRENKKALIDSAYDSIELGIDPDVLYKIYEANNVLYRNLMLVECRYGEYNDKELLNEKLFDTIASKVKGAIYGARALAKGQGISGAKQAYSGTSMDSRTQYFKNAIGDALHNIKKFDSSDETGLKSIEKFGSIDIKPSKGAVGGAVGDAISGVSSKVAQVAGTIKDKAGNVVSAAYETAMQSALFTYFKSLERTSRDKLKIPGGANAALSLLKQLANKIKPNLTISEDKSLVDKLLQLAQQNPGYANILVGLFISMSKVVMIAVGVATSKALIISAVLGIIVRTAYGKYVKGETVGQAFKKALIVTASTIAIGSLIKGMMAVIHHKDFLTGFKSYFVGGDAAAQQASTQQASTQQASTQQASTSGATPGTHVVTFNGHEYNSTVDPNGGTQAAIKNLKFDGHGYPNQLLANKHVQQIASGQDPRFKNLFKFFSTESDDPNGITDHNFSAGNAEIELNHILGKLNPADQDAFLRIAEKDPTAMVSLMQKANPSVALAFKMRLADTLNYSANDLDKLGGPSIKDFTSISTPQGFSNYLSTNVKGISPETLKTAKGLFSTATNSARGAGYFMDAVEQYKNNPKGFDAWINDIANARGYTNLSGTTPTNESVYKSTIKEYYNL